MQKYRLNLNGKEVTGLPGQTILEVARENDIFIPTLCFDERTEIYGSCGLCMCEVEGNPKLLKACATEIMPDMVIKTDTDRVIESRKTNLELLLSNHIGDCRPPCVKSCPAETDCQGYVALLANGEFEEGIRLVKNKIPLPASLGRVCPHPCETDCRRGLVDEPVAIQWLKRFLADTDLDLGEEKFIPDVAPETGKRVAIIGGGPMGLSAAYFLRQKGHGITIFEYMPKAGGMLRYGIPEYRLPKDVLDDEIDTLVEMGVEIFTNTRVGTDIKLKDIQEDYDAVIMAIGAWKSTGVGFEGEDAEGVIGGIDFLRKVVRNEPMDLGKNVAIVGGGNTAMDACRTAVRLGAENVYNIYRRTKDEMPADMVEIVEGEEEGVIFKNLTNPIKAIKDENGRVKQLVLQVMELGEPDESGRRKPVAVEGKTETIDVDTVILAIGQAVDTSMMDEELDGNLDKTKKGAIKYDSKTFRTTMPKVFAGGDCGNDKISIAVEAIADAKKVAYMIDAYLDGEDVEYREEYVVTRDDLTAEDFEDREKAHRPHMFHISPEERKDNFTEIIYDGYTMEDAITEAKRCLECGCHDYYECKLIDFANQYDVDPDRMAGDKKQTVVEETHPFIARDPNKCILCGLCVRVCDEVMGVGALGLVERGFETVVQPTLKNNLEESGCISCGQCVAVCPVGALQEIQRVAKEAPLPVESTDTTCAYCSIGCSLTIESCGDMLIKANPDKDGVVNKGLSCGKGKWGFDESMLEGKLFEPLIKDVDGAFRVADYHEAIMLTAKKMQSLAMKYGKDKAAVAISDRYTNEEAYAIKKMAGVMGLECFSFNNRESGLEKVLGFDASPNTMDELLSTNMIVMFGYVFKNNPIAQIKVKQAAEKGAKVVLVNPVGFEQARFDFAQTIYVENDLSFIKEVAKVLLDDADKSLLGYEELASSLANVSPREEAVSLAKAYKAAKKAMIVFQQNTVSTSVATMIANIAALSGHIGSPRDGILQLKAKNNSQGLIDLNIYKTAEDFEDLKALMVFGENPVGYDFSSLEFLMVSDTHMTDACEAADVVIPGTAFVSANGTFTNTERRLLAVEPVIDEDVDVNNWQLAQEIANVFEVDFGWEDELDISDEMNDTEPLYKYAKVDEVLDDIIAPGEISLVAVEDDKFIDILHTTDNLMASIEATVPTPKTLW